MGSEANQALLQTREEVEEYQLQNGSQGMDLGTITRATKAFDNLKQLKSLEIMRSALTVFTSNIKCMILMILSIIPLFVSMVSYETKLHTAIGALPKLLAQPYSYHYCDRNGCIDHTSSITNIIHISLELCAFYLVLYPLWELYSSNIVIQHAARIYAREKESVHQETINEVTSLIRYITGPLITSLWVHLLSVCTLVGLFWIVVNCFMISSTFSTDSYHYSTPDSLSTGLHVVFFAALLYKYLDWSAGWNMGIVISVLEKEYGIEALEMSGYYGKHCRRTGFELMLGFFTCSVVLRLLCLSVAGIRIGGVGKAVVTAIFMGLVCVGNLVKWVALVSYYNHCKAQTLQKKVDEGVGKAVEGAEFC